MLRRNTTEVLTGLLVLGVAFGFLGYALTHSGQDRIGEGYTLYARFDNVAGLNVGAPVRLAGVQVGRVDSEVVDRKTYLANVGMTIRRGIELPKDSSATVSSESLLGGSYLAIDPKLHDPLDQALVICGAGEEAAAARQLAAFIASREGREIMTRYGFSLDPAGPGTGAP